MSHLSHWICLMLAVGFQSWFLTGTANADDLSRKVAKCATMLGDLNRLACFDRTAEEAGLAGPQAQPVEAVGVGKWDITHNRNPIDDSERVVIALQAETGKSKWGGKVSFIARCQSNKTEAFIVWHDYLGDDSSNVYNKWKNVTIRIGDKKARTERWSISTDSKATFAPEWAGDLLKEMTESDRFLAQVTPYSESPTTAIFDTAGLSNAIKPLAKACEWTVE